MDTQPPTDVKTTSTTDKENALPLLMEYCKETLTNAEDRSILQMHFKMATQWQSAFP